MTLYRLMGYKTR